MGLGIKKDDMVYVLSGKDSGKKGRVLEMITKGDQVIVEQLNMFKKHIKPNDTHKQGGIIDKEAGIHVSNLKLVCPKCDKPTSIGAQILEDGRKLRVCKKCKEVIDQ